MVYETRAGQTLTLGATTWRVDEITRDRVIVSPAPGEAGRLPFWRGDGPGRPIELGRALGAFVRELGELAARGSDRVAEGARAPRRARRREPRRLRRRAARRRPARCRPTARSRSSASATSSATGASASCRRSARASTRRGRSRSRLRSRATPASRCRRSGATTASCCASPTPSGSPDREILVPEPEEVEDRVVEQLGAVRALRGAVPRERRARAAAAAPPARRAHAALRAAPARAEPARRRAAVPELPDRARDLSRVPAGRVRPARPRRPAARDPRARGAHRRGRDGAAPRRSRARSSSRTTAAYLYEGDAPAAERRAQALTLDRDMLRELLGQEELRDLLDATAIADGRGGAAGPRRGARARAPRRDRTICCAGSAT